MFGLSNEFQPQFSAFGEAFRADAYREFLGMHDGQ
jgi:hypothetical protein